MNKTERYRLIWENTILPAIPGRYLNGRNSKYYYKVQIWLHNLFQSIKEEELEVYLDWFVNNRLYRLDSFNAGILCCNKMVENFKRTGADYILQNSRKRIKNKEKDFDSQRKTEKQKFLNSILEKKQQGKRLSSFDKEALKYLQDEEELKKWTKEPKENISKN